MLIGYARGSTREQNYELQLDALEAAGCSKIFEEKMSGALRERPQLIAALDYLRPGDTLAVWRLDRLARSLKQLIETVEDLSERQIAFRSLTESIDTTTSGGWLIFQRRRSPDCPNAASGRASYRRSDSGAAKLRAVNALQAFATAAIDDHVQRTGMTQATPV